MRTLAACTLFMFAFGACDRTHMSPNFGVSNRDAYSAQVINPDAGNEVKPDQPLDPEEAATIARTYKRSLAPANAPTDPNAKSNLLLVVPSGAAGGAPGQGTAGQGTEGR